MDEVANDVLVVLTAKSAETCLRAGGTQSWVLNRANAKHLQYAVLCQNAKTDWGDGKEPHGTAFMVGRISDIAPSTEIEGRWLVLFDRYAEIRVSDVWQPTWRNPVRYTNFAELKIDFSDSSLREMPAPVAQSEAVKQASSSVSPQIGLIIADAKRGLAASLGLKLDAIEIIIRG